MRLIKMCVKIKLLRSFMIPISFDFSDTAEADTSYRIKPFDVEPDLYMEPLVKRSIFKMLIA